MCVTIGFPIYRPGRNSGTFTSLWTSSATLNKNRHIIVLTLHHFPLHHHLEKPLTHRLDKDGSTADSLAAYASQPRDQPQDGALLGTLHALPQRSESSTLTCIPGSCSKGISLQSFCLIPKYHCAFEIVGWTTDTVDCSGASSLPVLVTSNDLLSSSASPKMLLYFVQALSGQGGVSSSSLSTNRMYSANVAVGFDRNEADGYHLQSCFCKCFPWDRGCDAGIENCEVSSRTFKMGTERGANTCRHNYFDKKSVHPDQPAVVAEVEKMRTNTTSEK